MTADAGQRFEADDDEPGNDCDGTKRAGCEHWFLEHERRKRKPAERRAGRLNDAAVSKREAAERVAVLRKALGA